MPYLSGTIKLKAAGEKKDQYTHDNDHHSILVKKPDPNTKFKYIDYNA